VIRHEVPTRERDHRAQPLQERPRREDRVRLALVGVPQGVEDPTPLVDRQALGRKRWACDVATQRLEPAAAVRGHRDAGVEREARARGDQGRCGRIDGALPGLGGEETGERTAVLLARGSEAVDRGRGEVEQELVVALDLVAVRSPCLAFLEEPAQPRVDTPERPGDVGGIRRRQLVEAGGGMARGAGVDAVDEEPVEVGIEIERAARALQDVDGSRAEAQGTGREAQGASAPGGAREDGANEDAAHLGKERLVEGTSHA